MITGWRIFIGKQLPDAWKSIFFTGNKIRPRIDDMIRLME